MAKYNRKKHSNKIRGPARFTTIPLNFSPTLNRDSLYTMEHTETGTYTITATQNGFFNISANSSTGSYINTTENLTTGSTITFSNDASGYTYTIS